MARDRSDTRWQHCEDAWQRLRWARETAGYRSAAAFAREPEADIEEATYRAYERPSDGDGKHIDLSFERARSWAPLMKVRWEWLYEGVGLPWLEGTDRSFSAEARDLAEAVDKLPEQERRAKVAAIKALLTGTDG